MSSPTSSSWPNVEMANSPNSVLSTSSQSSTSESESQFSFSIQQRFSSFQQKYETNKLQPPAEITQTEEDGESLISDDDEGNASAFTDPSWYGSPFARRDSQLAWPTSPLRATKAECMQGNKEDKTIISQSDEDINQKFEAYQKGLTLARRALFDLDSELDQKGIGEEISLQKSTKAMGKRKAIDDRSALPATPSCGTEILTSFEQSPCYLCACCGTTLALQDELISKAFSGRDGKAYLFFSILNIRSGPKEDRQLLTGLHTVADLSCATCQKSVGWSYLRAFEASQRYKEGKFILERASLHKSNNWSSLALNEEEEVEMIF